MYRSVLWTRSHAVVVVATEEPGGPLWDWKFVVGTIEVTTVVRGRHFVGFGLESLVV